MTTIPSAILKSPDLANKIECLVTNGTGSFASLAINGGLSRKFHGLLVHSVIPPMDRQLTWHSCVETVDDISLDARRWLAGISHICANGEKYILHFNAKPMPTWVYNINGALLKKELFMAPGSATTILKYSLLAAPNDSIDLTLENYVHFREAGDHKSQFQMSDLTNWQVDASRQCIANGALTLKLGLQMDTDQNQVATIGLISVQTIKLPIYCMPSNWKIRDIRRETAVLKYSKRR